MQLSRSELMKCICISKQIGNNEVASELIQIYSKNAETEFQNRSIHTFFTIQNELSEKVHSTFDEYEKRMHVAVGA